MDYDPHKHADMRPGFGPVLGPRKPPWFMTEAELVEDQRCEDQAVRAALAEPMRSATAAQIQRGLDVVLIVALALIALWAFCPKASADEPYLEVSATRIQSYVKTFPGVTESLVEQRGFWGAEIVGRYPLGDRFALVGRFYSEGAAGAHSWKDPSTWHRAVGEGALSYRVLRFDANRYTLGVLVGAGASRQLQRGHYTQIVPDEDLELDGAPPKYGLGVHLRDSRLGSWVNARAEWDKAAGPGASWCGGCMLAGSAHFPVMGAKGGFGADVTYGEYLKVNLVAKIRLKRWGGK